MKPTEKNEFYSPMRTIMLTVMIIGIIGCFVFGMFYYCRGAKWALPVAVTFGMFAYHMMIRFLSPVILVAFSHRKYNYNSAWFRPKAWEEKLYRFLKVKRWKGKAMTYDPSEFSLQVHSLEEIINNMCHAELTHEMIVVLSFTSLAFSIPFGSFPAFLITAILAAMFDTTFVFIQRYNRPRMVKIMNRVRKS